MANASNDLTSGKTPNFSPATNSNYSCSEKASTAVTEPNFFQNSITFGSSAKFTDFLFASVLRPASTETPVILDATPLALPGSACNTATDRSPALSSLERCDQSTAAVFPKMCSLRWFSRRPLIERQVKATGTEFFFSNVMSNRDVAVRQLMPRVVIPCLNDIIYIYTSFPFCVHVRERKTSFFEPFQCACGQSLRYSLLYFFWCGICILSWVMENRWTKKVAICCKRFFQQFSLLGSRSPLYLRSCQGAHARLNCDGK